MEYSNEFGVLTIGETELKSEIKSNLFQRNPKTSIFASIKYSDIKFIQITSPVTWITVLSIILGIGIILGGFAPKDLDDEIIEGDNINNREISIDNEKLMRAANGEKVDGPVATIEASSEEKQMGLIIGVPLILFGLWFYNRNKGVRLISVKKLEGKGKNVTIFFSSSNEELFHIKSELENRIRK